MNIENEKLNNLVGEWFGVRLFPESHCKEDNLADFKNEQCPFLSEITSMRYKCTKNVNSKGVCTITTRNGEGYQDWMVCPYRALNYSVLKDVVKKLFNSNETARILPVVSLKEKDLVESLKSNSEKFYLFFQDKLGGEISLLGSLETPEMSFDVTIVEAKFDNNSLLIGKFGILEVQTMDFHGTYRGAVDALRSAVDLHGEDFPKVINERPDWLARGIEGPNIANVFKRTFYQIVLKFKLANKNDCVGVILALPKSVWNSWRPHLANISFEKNYVNESIKSDHTWIFIIDLHSENSNSSNDNTSICSEIAVSANELIKAAFDTVPLKMENGSLTNVHSQILSRIRKIYSNVK